MTADPAGIIEEAAAALNGETNPTWLEREAVAVRLRSLVREMRAAKPVAWSCAECLWIRFRPDAKQVDHDICSYCRAPIRALYSTPPAPDCDCGAPAGPHAWHDGKCPAKPAPDSGAMQREGESERINQS